MDHLLTHVDRKELPLTRKDGGQNEGRGTDNAKNRPGKSARHTHLSWELRKLDEQVNKTDWELPLPSTGKSLTNELNSIYLAKAHPVIAVLPWKNSKKPYEYSANWNTPSRDLYLIRHAAN